MSTNEKQVVSYSMKEILLKDLISKVKSDKKINLGNNTDKEVASIVEELLEYVDLFNSLDSEATALDGYSLTDLTIINEFAQFIQPASIRFNISTYLTQELKANVDSNFKFNKLAFEECQSKFRNLFKKDAVTDRTSVSDLRKHVNLTDIIDKVAYPCIQKQDSYMFVSRYLNEAYIPYFISLDLSLLFKEGYYNSNSRMMIKDYLSNYRF